jgi:hypothetical protein
MESGRVVVRVVEILGTSTKEVFFVGGVGTDDHAGLWKGEVIIALFLSDGELMFRSKGFLMKFWYREMFVNLRLRVP